MQAAFLRFFERKERDRSLAAPLGTYCPLPGSLYIKYIGSFQKVKKKKSRSEPATTTQMGAGSERNRSTASPLRAWPLTGRRGMFLAAPRADPPLLFHVKNHTTPGVFTGGARLTGKSCPTAHEARGRR